MSAAFLIVACMASLQPTPVAAGIVCKDGFQSVDGSEISTPYCQDELLAQVARNRGMRVTGAAIRSDPQVKEDACRLASSDFRMQDHCSRYNDSDSRSR
jgi:hypothetical protein